MTLPTPLPSGTLTFLFTDIEGSTARWEHQREAMASALVRHDAIVRGAIEAHGGHVFKTGGDAFCAAFAGAADALAAALDAQRALAVEDWATFGPDFADLLVRMGLHTGHADARGGDFFGPALNRAARVMAAGHGGQVLVTRSVQERVADCLPAGCRLRDLGEHRLKDLRHSEHVYQLVAEGLPDIVKSPNTAGELRSRDRIVVRDPDAAPDEAVDADAVIVLRDVPETLAALKAVIRGDERTLVLTASQVSAVVQHKPADPTEYRLVRIAEWSQPRYRLDGRFVALTLLYDEGEERIGGRWKPDPHRYDDLGAMLAGVPDPAVVVLGPPGSGKSTLLRHLELDLAIANLRGEDPRDTVTFFIQLNQYKPAEPGQPLPSPARWLAARWAAANPDLRGLDDLLAEGRVTLLLDALNEMPVASEREFRERVGLWKDWLVHLVKECPGNRVVLSCRALDYSAPLSTPALRVPQVQIEPLSDGQVRSFLQLYSPVRGEAIWKVIAGTPQLEALRSPFFLALLVDQVEATGELAGDRAGLFTGFVRQALRREVERDNPLFALEELLSSRDVRRIAQWQWASDYELPERGALVPKLSGLAYRLQEADAGGGGSQVRVDYDTALDLLDHAEDEQIVRAGVSIAVLDEDPAADEVLYRHQLLQEYFAARVLSRHPRPDLVRAPWRAAEITPGVREVLESLPRSETLPALPTTGWEETTVLAAAMTQAPEPFIRALMAANLVVAGRAASLPTVRSRLDDLFLDELRWALVERSRDPYADLRARIEAGLTLGRLGDPRFERHEGPHGAYLLPPLVQIPGGLYPIGDDEPIVDDDGETTYRGHLPRHMVRLAPFAIGQFAVTNAEYACFMAAGGYDDERWWDTDAARAWRSGEGTGAGVRWGVRRGLAMIRAAPITLENWHDSGQISDERYEGWKRRLAMSDDELEASLAKSSPPKRLTEPEAWHDARYDNPSQPVVTVSWYEARAYCLWLSAQTGRAYRLATEVEREAAASGQRARRYAHGDAFDRLAGNTLPSYVRRPSPVGAFVDGDTPEGVSDLGGNTTDWTLSLWGRDPERPAFAYPYDAGDGREDPRVSDDVLPVVRGGTWHDDELHARAVHRVAVHPCLRSGDLGFRVAAPQSVHLFPPVHGSRQ